MSTNYGYTVASTDWTGTDAKEKWNGKGSPGDQDPTVDILDSSRGAVAYAFGEPTSETLNQFVAAARAANAKIHPCTAQLSSTAKTTIDGAPAVVDSGHCPPSGGPFVMIAYVVHSGRAYVFFTMSFSPGGDHFVRTSFLPLLSEIRFTD